jgi:hypothetical protein
MRCGSATGAVAGAALIAGVFGTCVLGTLAVAQPAPGAGVISACVRTDFEAVVARAGDTLRALTQQNSPNFQGKLRALKDKRGWSHDQFLAEGTRFVRDEKIAEFEEKSGQLLARINDIGGSNSGQAGTDCAKLAELKSHMTSLVDIQTAKWAYMFTNIDAELAK